MSHYNELPFVVVNNNGVDVKVYDVDLSVYKINRSMSLNPTYVSLDGKKESRMKTRPYAQYSAIAQRTSASKSFLYLSILYKNSPISIFFNSSFKFKYFFALSD